MNIAEKLKEILKDYPTLLENVYHVYSEPGYDTPKSGCIVLANWNKIPDSIQNELNELNVEMEWSDEWITCDNCMGLIRTEPDSYWWKPSMVVDNEHGTINCHKCLKDNIELVEKSITALINNQKQYLPQEIDISKWGWTKKEFQQNDMEKFVSEHQNEYKSALFIIQDSYKTILTTGNHIWIKKL